MRGGNIKGHIKNVMNFKKPAAWVTIISVLLVVALIFGFAVNKRSDTLNVANIVEAILTTEIDGWYPLIKGTPYYLNDKDINFITELINESSKKRILDEYKPTYGDLYKIYCTIRIVMAETNSASEGTYKLLFYNHKDWSIIHGESEYKLALVDPSGEKTWLLSYDTCYQFKSWLERYINRLISFEENIDLGES